MENFYLLTFSMDKVIEINYLTAIKLFSTESMTDDMFSLNIYIE